MSERARQVLLLESLTYQEVGDLIRTGTASVTVAVGAIEQHGPHLALSVDSDRGDRLAAEVAARLGRCMVAPTIRVGCSEHHMGFSGTLSLRPETLQAVCVDYVASLSAHGFQQVYFIPTHGGNFGPIKAVLKRLRAAAGEKCEVYAYTDLVGFVKLWEEAVAEAAPGLEGRVGGHADIAESSEMLDIRPERTRARRAVRGRVGKLDEAFKERLFTEGMRAVAPTGVLGDARGMSRDIGLACIDRTADGVASAFVEMRRDFLGSVKKTPSPHTRIFDPQ